jgi:o-succinylbenzoate---CoA ligase
MGYPFTSIWINGRPAKIEDIIRQKVKGRTPFEETTFEFISQWFLDVENFTIHTSGSTGEPKKISVSRAQMIQSATLSQGAIGFKRDDTALLCIDTKFIGGKMMLVRALHTGMRIIAVDPGSLPLHKVPVDVCVNFAAVVPYQVRATLDTGHSHILNNLDNVIIGGAPLDQRTIDQLQVFQCNCCATYGMTETLSHVALRRLNGPQKQEYFETLPGVKYSLDERGCLVLNVPFLKEAIVTNDIAESKSPTQFRWIGRWDNVINSGGVKVMPERIEAALEKIFNSRNIQNRFFVEGVPDQRLGSRVTLVIEGSAELHSIIEPALVDLQGHFSPYEIPKQIVFAPSFVLTESGKVNRKQTLTPVLEGASPD